MSTRLVIQHNDGARTYHSIEKRGWRIDTPTRTVVIGKGLGRTIVPLDTVRFIEFAVVEVPDIQEPGNAQAAEAPPAPSGPPKPGPALFTQTLTTSARVPFRDALTDKGVTLYDGGRVVWTSESGPQSKVLRTGDTLSFGAGTLAAVKYAGTEEVHDGEWCSIYGYDVPKEHACAVGVCFNPYRDGQELKGTLEQRLFDAARLSAELRS